MLDLLFKIKPRQIPSDNEDNLDYNGEFFSNQPILKTN